MSPSPYITGQGLTHFGENVLETQVHLLFAQLVAIVLEPFDELLDRAVGLEGEEREAERDVASLSRVLRETEPLAEFLDNVLSLLLLHAGKRTKRPAVRDGPLEA